MNVILYYTFMTDLISYRPVFALLRHCVKLKIAHLCLCKESCGKFLILFDNGTN